MKYYLIGAASRRYPNKCEMEFIKDYIHWNGIKNFKTDIPMVKHCKGINTKYVCLDGSIQDGYVSFCLFTTKEGVKEELKDIWYDGEGYTVLEFEED